VFLENVTRELRVGYCPFTSCLLYTELSFQAFIYVESLVYSVGTSISRRFASLHPGYLDHYTLFDTATFRRVALRIPNVP